MWRAVNLSIQVGDVMPRWEPYAGKPRVILLFMRGFNATGARLLVFRPLALLRVNGQNGRYAGNWGNIKFTTEIPLGVGPVRAQQVKVALR